MRGFWVASGARRGGLDEAEEIIAISLIFAKNPVLNEISHTSCWFGEFDHGRPRFVWLPAALQWLTPQTVNLISYV